MITILDDTGLGKKGNKERNRQVITKCEAYAGKGSSCVRGIIGQNLFKWSGQRRPRLKRPSISKLKPKGPNLEKEQPDEKSRE